MNNLFAEFESQFKEPAIPQPKVIDSNVKMLDEYEAYRKATHPAYTSYADFVKMKAGKPLSNSEQYIADRNAVIALEEASKTNMREGAIGMGHANGGSPFKGDFEIELPEQKGQAGLFDEPKTGMLQKALQQSMPPVQYVASVDPVNIPFDAPVKNIFKKKLDEMKAKEANYQSMPQGMKEAQQLNGVKDHGLDLLDKVKVDRLDNVAHGIKVGDIIESSEVTGRVVKVDPSPTETAVARYEGRPDSAAQFLADVEETAKYYGCVIEEEATTKIWVGIDPGKAGAIVAIDRRGIIGKWPIPLFGTDVDAQGIWDILDELKKKGDITLVLEEVHSLHKMAANTNFSMGHTLGIIVGIVIASKIRLIRIAPKSWQKEVWISSEIEYLPIKPDQSKPSINTKLTSMKAAHRLFPSEDFRKSARSTKDHDGICDAILMAEYGRRKNL